MNGEKKEVFISYHAESAGEMVRKVSAALEGAGVSCWYAPRDCDEQYAGSIVAAIRNCRVFLLILNEKSNLSAHVLNEINCAFDRFRNHEDITLLPFRIDNCTLSDDVYYYLGRMHIMDGALPPEMVRVQELVDRISTILGREPARRAVVVRESGPAREYRLTGSIVYPDNHFVGRERELEGIHRALSGVENKLFLVGMGGIGKSEIAKMYLKRHAAEYDVVLWVSFDGTIERTVCSDAAVPVRGLSRADFPEDDDRTYFLRKLGILKEIADRRVLLVLDNFDVTEDPDLELLCGGAFGVLFTTRYHQTCGNIPEVEVREMEDEAELLALFRAEYTRPLDGPALDRVREIIALLSGHTLSIRLVASAMQSRRIKPEQMAELLCQGEQGMAEKNARAADLIFGRLRQVFRLSTLSEEEQFLLKNLSLISLRGIPVETLYDWCEADDFDVIDGLIRKSWVIHDPVSDEVHLHPLVSDLMAEALSEDLPCCDGLVANLRKATESSAYLTYEEKQRLYGHGENACRHLPEGSPQWRQAMYCRAKMTLDMAMYRRAAELYSQLQDGAADLTERVALMGQAAHSRHMSGDPAACFATAKAAFDLIRDISLDEMPFAMGVEYVFLLHRLCESSRALGDLDSSVEYARMALDPARRFPRQSAEKSVGWTEYHLACSLLERGDLDESEAALRRGIALFDSIDDAWSAEYARDMLSQVLARRGQFDEALSLNRNAGELVVRLYGSKHADAAANLTRKGNIYRLMGDAAKAAGCYRQAADLYRECNCPGRADGVLALLAELDLAEI